MAPLANVIFALPVKEIPVVPLAAVITMITFPVIAKESDPAKVTDGIR